MPRKPYGCKARHLFCRTCGDQVRNTKFRDHLEGHNVNASNMSTEEVLDQFSLAPPGKSYP